MQASPDNTPRDTREAPRRRRVMPSLGLLRHNAEQERDARHPWRIAMMAGPGQCAAVVYPDDDSWQSLYRTAMRYRYTPGFPRLWLETRSPDDEWEGIS